MSLEEIREYVRNMPENEIVRITFLDGKEDHEKDGGE